MTIAIMDTILGMVMTEITPRALILNRSAFKDSLLSYFTNPEVVSSLKEMVRFLVANEVDLIVAPAKKTLVSKLQKVARAYEIPVLLIGCEDESLVSNEHLWLVNSPQDVPGFLKEQALRIENFQLIRQNKRHQWVLEQLTRFTNETVQTSRDLFITETKNYFKEHCRVESCHWVSLKIKSSKLPPILRLKQELEKQKVNQSTLIDALESCSTEVFSQDNFQIWQKGSGEYLALLWIHEENNLSQCLILNGWIFRNRLEIQDYLSYLAVYMKKRWHLCNQVASAQREVYHDSLTNLYNQKFLNEVLKRKIEENKRYKTPFSVLFIDVDHFKRVNDSMGHLVGSGVLKKMAKVLKQQIRSSDFAFRYGGDEFIVLLSHTEGEDAVSVANRIRKEVENHQFIVDKIEVRITVSIGLAFFPKHAQSATDIIRIADEAMYYGKHKGRNIVYKAS